MERRGCIGDIRQLYPKAAVSGAVRVFAFLEIFAGH